MKYPNAKKKLIKMGFRVIATNSEFDKVFFNGKMYFRMTSVNGDLYYHAQTADGNPMSWHGNAINGDQVWIGPNYHIEKKDIDSDFDREMLKLILAFDIANDGHYRSNYTSGL